MSKPAVQNITAAVSKRIGGSSVPRTAIQAAAGAMPSVKPSTRCDRAVKRFVAALLLFDLQQCSKTAVHRFTRRAKAGGTEDLIHEFVVNHDVCSHRGLRVVCVCFYLLYTLSAGGVAFA